MNNKDRVYGYKIRNTETGLYLRGGADTSESRVGRVWTNRAAAIRAVNMKLKAIDKSWNEQKKIQRYREGVLSYEVVELVEGGSNPIHFYLNDLNF